MTCTVHEDQHTFFDHITVFLRMRNVLDKSFGENKNTSFYVLFFFFFSFKNRSVYEIM